MPLFTPCLCLVTDSSLCTSDSLEDMVDGAVAGGVDMVQLREKEFSKKELIKLGLNLRHITKARALLVVNGSLDVALAVGADGLHLPESDMSIYDARQIAPSNLLLGKSVHDPNGAEIADAEGADYLILGTIFQTSSKPGLKTGGPELVSIVTSLVHAPVLAIGGITASSMATVIESGARGVAVRSAILDARNPESAARELKQSMTSKWMGTASYGSSEQTLIHD